MTKVNRGYPHELCCPCCREAGRCNRCGCAITPSTRCTNGRCSACCNRHCKHMPSTFVASRGEDF
jgi:hypothetical protein